MAAPRRGRPRNEEARRRIAEAGCALFVREGYVGTTIGDIAAEAQVSVQTIYAAYVSKVGVLKAAHDVAIGGVDERPLLDREWARELDRWDSAESAWAAALEQVARATEQVAPIYAVIQRGSADPEVALLLAELHEQRYRFSRTLADRLVGMAGVRADADPQRVGDVLYSCVSVSSYIPFVIECGWTVEQWKCWAAEIGAGELFTR